MFGIGAGELMILMALALIIVGPQKLPEMGRTVGKAFAEFKAYTDDMRSVLTLEQPSATPTSHFPGIGGAQAYKGATEQVAAIQPSTVESVAPTDEVSPASEPAAVPVPVQPLTVVAPKSYFSEETVVESVAAATSAAPLSGTTHI